MIDPGVTFVVPVHNGERWLDRALGAIVEQRDDRPFEVIVVDDGSSDASPAILESWRRREAIRVVAADAGSHPAALNIGVRASSHPVVCLVDQDVVLQPGWLREILEGLSEPGVAAVQGTFVTDRRSPLVARVMGLDLEERYAAMGGPETGHVCTGNSAYRADALRAVGLFDESFGYGADNDMSYRLRAAGHELRFRPAAKAVHHWRPTLWRYLVQQYGVGYGRLDLVAKHRRHLAGDTVSPATMMAHAPLMLAAILAGLVWLTSIAAGRRAAAAGWLALALTAGLGLERFTAGTRAFARRHDPAGLFFAPIHLLRDTAWAVAMVAWSARRLAGRGRRPGASMPRSSRK
jgi:GT2 family glycosyltransferase